MRQNIDKYFIILIVNILEILIRGVLEKMLEIKVRFFYKYLMYLLSFSVKESNVRNTFSVLRFREILSRVFREMLSRISKLGCLERCSPEFLKIVRKKYKFFNVYVRLYAIKFMLEWR